MKWIPMSEAKPQYGQNVIVTVKNDVCEFVTIATYYEQSRYFEDVVAWMPFPRPYKGSEEYMKEEKESRLSNREKLFEALSKMDNHNLAHCLDFFCSECPADEDCKCTTERIECQELLERWLEEDL